MSLLIQANWWLEFNFDGAKLLEALQIFESLGVPYEQSHVSGMIADFANQNRQKPAEIKKYIEKSNQFYVKFGDLHPGFNYLIYITSSPDSYFLIGEFENGFAAFHEEQKFFEQSGHAVGWLAGSLNWESQFAVQYSTFDHAVRTRQLSLELAKESGIQTFILWGIYEFGEVYRVFGNQAKAMELYEQARAGFEKIYLTLGLGYYQRAYGNIALQNAQYQIALVHFQEYMKYASEDNHLWSIAQAHGTLARAHAHLGNLNQSRDELLTALTQTYAWGKDGLALDSLLAEPVCLMQEGNYEQAVELLSFILNHKLSWNQTKQQTKLLMAKASGQLPPKMVESAKKRGGKILLEELIIKYT